MIQFHSTNYTVTEGEQVFVEILLNFAVDRTITVDIVTTDASATAADFDYTSLTETLIFVAGQTQVLVPLFTLEDAILEPDEDFQVSLSNPSKGIVISEENLVAVITILDQEGDALKVWPMAKMISFFSLMRSITR